MQFFLYTKKCNIPSFKIFESTKSMQPFFSNFSDYYIQLLTFYLHFIENTIIKLHKTVNEKKQQKLLAIIKIKKNKMK